MLKDVESIETREGYDSQPLLIHCPPEVRTAFVKRVYSLLTLQLLFTGGVGALFAFAPSGRQLGVKQLTPLCMGGGVGALICACALIACKSKHPWNLLLLALFTLCEATSLGALVSLYCSAGRGALVVGALAATTLLFAGLSCYVHVTRREFAFLNGLLAVGLFSLVAAGIVSLFAPSMLLESMIASVGVVVFSGFVLYDTSELIHRMGPDDAVVAVVQLYLDFVNLFLSVLQVLNCSANE